MRLFVVDPNTNDIVTIPEDQLAQAVEQGFRQASPGEVAQYKEKLDFTDLPSQALAAAAGAARALTFGGSDLALTQTGLVKPETLKKLEEYNPVESIAGETAAIGASFLVPGAGPATAAGRAARAATAPIRAATEVGETVAKQAAQLLPGMTGGLGRVTKAGVTLGAGAAAESGLYGLGRAVTEYSMGQMEGMSPPDMAEAVFTHVGMPMLIGGGIGAALGSTFGLSKEAYLALKKALPDTPPSAQILKESGVDIAPEIPKTELGDALGIESRSIAEQESFITGIKKRSEIANDVEGIALKHNLPVFEEQLTRDPDIIAKADALRNSPSTIGVERKRSQLQAEQYWRDKIEQSVAIPEDLAQLSKKEIGDRAIQKISEKISESQAEHSARFKIIHDLQSTVDLSDKARLKFWKKSEDIAAKFGVFGDEPFDEAMKVTQSLLKRNTGSELLIAISNAKETARSLFRAGKPRAATAINEIVSESENMLFKEVLRLGREIEKEGGEFAGAIASDIVKDLKAAKRDYAAFARQRKEIMNALGIRGPEQTYLIREKLAQMSPETIVNKLFAKKNVKVAEFFEKYAPDVMEDIKAFQKNAMKEAAIPGEGMQLSVKQMFQQYDKTPKELRNLLFTPEQQLMFKEAELYLRAIPEDLNKSRTAYTAAYMQNQGLFGLFSPENWKNLGVQFVQDAHTASELRRYNLTSDDIAKAHWVVDTTTKVKRSIIKKTREIFSPKPELVRGSRRALAFTSAQIAESLISHEKPEKLISKVYEVANNPNVFIDKMSQNTADFEQLMPETYQAMQTTALNAARYLATNAPPVEPDMPLDDMPTPSKSELNLFAEKLSLIKDPVSVLDEISFNTLTPERVEALKGIYPALYQQMQIQLIESLADAKAKKKPISYLTKNMLSLFLGQDLDSAITPQSVQQNQVIMQAATQEREMQEARMSGVRPTVTGLGKLNLSSQNLTAMQKSSERMERG